MAKPGPQNSSQMSTDTPCASGGSQSQTETLQECPKQPPVLQLRLNQPKNEQKVKWTTDTVDNEFMGKKKSKCCCIYEKPKVFGELSSSEEEEGDDSCTPHCKGHKKKCFRKKPSHCPHQHSDDHEGAGPSGPPECPPPI